MNWTLKKQGINQIGGLAIQFVLGMTTTLFVVFPENTTEVANWEFAKTQLFFMLHLVLAWILFTNATIMLVRAFRKNDKVWKISGGIGWISITTALVAGSIFTGTQQDNLSMLMAIGFIAAMLSYVWGIYRSR